MAIASPWQHTRPHFETRNPRAGVRLARRRGGRASCADAAEGEARIARGRPRGAGRCAALSAASSRWNRGRRRGAITSATVLS